MDRREFVRATVVRVLEKALAGDAVAIGVLLAAVFVQSVFRAEDLFTHRKDGERMFDGSGEWPWSNYLAADITVMVVVLVMFLEVIR